MSLTKYQKIRHKYAVPDTTNTFTVFEQADFFYSFSNAIRRFGFAILSSLQVTLSIELNDSQVEEFQKMIPVQLAEPPWNYTRALSSGIMVCVHYSHSLSAAQ